MTDVPLYLLEAEFTGITAGADEPDFDDEKAAAMMAQIFALGEKRIQELAAHRLTPKRYGAYYLPHCSLGYGSDFYHHANYALMKEKFPWLGLDSDGGILGDKIIEDSGARDLEQYLARIPDTSWDEFLAHADLMRENGEIDPDATQELVQQEEARWMEGLAGVLH